MDPRTTTQLYYDAWRNRAGDMTGVPLADDFAFSGPVASFDTADGFRAMARQAGAAVRGFEVRHQFADGDLVCSVIDWEMAMLPGVLTAAELLEVRDGTIVRGELIYDAEDLRRAMAAPQQSVVGLLDRGLRDAADVLARVDQSGWDAPSPCAGWTVRQVGNHLVGSIALLTRIVADEPVDAGELDGQKLADTDHLGADPAAALHAVAERSVAAFGRAGTLDRRFPMPVPDAPGQLIADLCLLESLVHGWDIANGAGVDYRPDDAVVAAVRDFSFTSIGDGQRGQGLFGPAVPTGQNADRTLYSASARRDAFTATLGHLGRRA